MWMTTALTMLLGVAAQDSRTFGIQGTVLDENRQPVDGAEVRLFQRDPGGSKLASTARADRSGRFEVKGWTDWSYGWERDWRIEATAPGYATSMVDAIFGLDYVYDIGHVFLFRVVQIEGTVRDGAGRPVFGARIHAIQGAPPHPHPDFAASPPRATTDERGRFQIDALPPGNALIGVSAVGFADSERQVVLRAGAPNELSFSLTPAPESSLRIVDPDGRPISAARVAPYHEFHRYSGPPKAAAFPASWRAEETASTDGVVSLSGIGNRNAVAWKVRARGFKPVVIGAGDWPITDTIVLSPAPVVLVRTEREGSKDRPSLRSVKLRDSRWPEGTCGTFERGAWTELNRDSEEVEVLEPGVWRIRWADLDSRGTGGKASGARGTSSQGGLSEWLTIPEDSWRGDQVECLLRFPPLRTITGRVLDASRNPVSSVGLTLRSNGVESTVATDDKGVFRIHDVDDSLPWLCVFDPVWSQISQSQLVDIKKGEGTRVERIVEPRAAPKRVLGRFTVAGRPPSEPLPVGLGESGGQAAEMLGGGPRGMGITGLDGTFAIVPRWPRKFTVVPKRPTRLSDGGYRQFRSEFLRQTEGAWPFSVDASRDGDAWIELDLPEWR